MPVTIEKLGEQIGAVVSGVDISSPIDEETLSLLRRAFYSHSVLVFRDQEISNEQHIAFSGGFGPLEMTIANDPVGDGGPIGVICNVDESGAAYATLPAARQSLIEDLVAEHSLAYSRSQIAADLMEDGFLKNTPPTPHPLVRMIPETGEKVLLVGSYATHIVGRPVEEGRTLLRELLEWATQPQFVYRHEWQLHDLVMWDNVSCLHRGRPWDGWNHRRVMHRTTLSGDALVPR